MQMDLSDGVMCEEQCLLDENYNYPLTYFQLKG